MTDPWTPGPWRILPDTPMDSLTIVGGDGSYVALAGLLDNRVQVANARLIVAAPDLVEALDNTLRLIRRAQDRLSMHLQPDSSDDDGEVLNELLTMFDGPEQRAVEKPARAVLARVRGEPGKEEK